MHVKGFPGASSGLQGPPAGLQGPPGASRRLHAHARCFEQKNAWGEAEISEDGQAGLGHPPWREGGGGWPG